MIARYPNLQRYPRVFRSLTGLGVGEFDQLMKDVTPLYTRSELSRHALTREGRDRQRAIGAGPHFSLGMRDQLLLTVVWLRVYPTNEVLGFLFGVSDSTASRLVNRWVPLLAKAGKDQMRMPDPGRKHRRSLDDLLREIPELGVVIDTFEQPVQRPTDREQADRWYSGKKRRHTIKSQVGVDRNSGEVVDVGESVPGPTNDLTLLKASRLMQRLPPGVSGEGDLAYVGIASLHPGGLGFTPRRKPRGAESPEEQKAQRSRKPRGADKHRPRGKDKVRPPQDIAYNTAFARCRVVVEHTILRMRRYECLGQTDRHHRNIKGHTERVAAVAGLVNTQIRHRLPYLVN